MLSSKYFIAIVLPEPIQGKIENIKHTLFQKHGLKGAQKPRTHYFTQAFRMAGRKGEKFNRCIKGV